MEKKPLLGVNIGAGFSNPETELIQTVASVGFDACFINWSREVSVEACAEQIAKSNLIFQSIHAPFRKVETLWDEGEDGELFVDEMIACLQDCERFDVPVMVVHPIKGMDRHTPNELGLLRFSRLIEEAEKRSVKLAFENVEGIEYLDAVMNRFGDSSAVGFCWDTGHEMCYNFSEDVMAKYGDKLIATHFNDNMKMHDPAVVTWHDDLHLLPFDGKGDWQGIMDRIARHGYAGILTFELTVKNKPNHNYHDAYTAWTAEEFYRNAYERACRVAALGSK